MSLSISTPLTTNDGIVLNNTYGRIQVVDDFNGKNIQAILNIYASESTFKGGYNPLSFRLETFLSIPYLRETDGPDVLGIAHDAFVSKLASVGITALKSLD